MYYSFSKSRMLLKVGVFFLILSILGCYFNALAIFIAIGALILLAMSYWELNRLNHWLHKSKKMTPPTATGMWGYIYDGIYHLQRRNRARRKELSKMVKRFREGSEALPDSTVVVDADGSIVWCNKRARVELGLRWPQDTGRRIDNLIRHPKFIAFFQSGDFINPVEVPSPLNIQKIFEYRMMKYGGQHTLLIVRDVTGLMQLEQMRRDFVANVSHELRTPLTVVSGYLEMLSGDSPVPQAMHDKAVSEMSSQSKRMQTLIEELLVLSRIEASAENVLDKVVDVPQLLKIIKGEAKALNKEKQHKITFNVDPNLHIYGLETELRSAFSNLIFNAIHYTPSPGNIVVTWLWDGNNAQFSVKDDGDGIGSQHLSRLTERFYRVDKARSRATGGSGLGLAIVKHVLAHHNSKLRIRSQINTGSEFSFELSGELVATKKTSNSKVLS
jgi:two-component system phosphate regulon sensor histidine kinase PhoR